MDFVATDAFGDFVFLGPNSPTSSTGPSPDGSSSSGLSREQPHRTGCIFLFPVRSKASTSVTLRTSNCQQDVSPDVAADATANLVAKKSLQGCKSEPSVAKADVEPGDATISRESSKQDTSFSGRLYERSTSLDVANPLLTRDQSSAGAFHFHDAQLTSSLSVGVHGNCSSQPASARRSGGTPGSSGGGAPPHGSNHGHTGWHSTEWWRSFSSSRLNEMAAEEPDKRSPEMRRVPYVGGAEPMCKLAHGPE